MSVPAVASNAQVTNNLISTPKILDGYLLAREKAIIAYNALEAFINNNPSLPPKIVNNCRNAQEQDILVCEKIEKILRESSNPNVQNDPRVISILAPAL